MEATAVANFHAIGDESWNLRTRSGAIDSFRLSLPLVGLSKQRFPGSDPARNLQRDTSLSSALGSENPAARSPMRSAGRYSHLKTPRHPGNAPLPGCPARYIAECFPHPTIAQGCSQWTAMTRTWCQNTWRTSWTGWRRTRMTSSSTRCPALLTRFCPPGQHFLDPLAPGRNPLHPAACVCGDAAGQRCVPAMALP